jgi:uncharacterized membrane-anchored protein YitT (DUF2179 family)
MKRWWLFVLSVIFAFTIHLHAQTNYVVLGGVTGAARNHPFATKDFNFTTYEPPVV